MGKKENDVFNLCRIECGKLGVPIYRNNIGFDNEKKIHYGLKIGSGDGIGIYPMVVTQDMVGSIVGIFFSCETKATTGLNDDQKKWRDNIIARGGIAIVARSPKDIPLACDWKFPNGRSA